MAYPKSIAETVSLMQKQMSLTFGWDVVVNYSVDSINKLLEETFRTKPQTQITKLDLKVSGFDPRTDEEYEMQYSLNLGSPRIAFSARTVQGPSCNLSIPIVDGNVQVDGSKSTAVPRGVYTLELLYLKLATARGYWDSNTKRPGEAFVFPDDKADGYVVIDLPVSNDLVARISKSPNSAKFPLIDNFTELMEKSIKAMFLSNTGVYNNIRYEIARVNPRAPDGSYQLRPKSFLFDAFLPSDSPKDEDVGILSLFIQTGDSMGKQEQLFTAWEGQWRVTLKCSPIPLGETASIIISRQMVYDKVIQPTLRDKGFTVKKLDESYSFKMEIDTHKTASRSAQGRKEGITTYYVSSVDVRLPPFQLELTERNSSGGSFVSWKYEYGYDWNYSRIIDRIVYKQHGSVKVFNQVEKFNRATLDDRHLTIGTSVLPPDWKVEYKPNQPSGWDALRGEAGWLPDWAKVEVDFPSFDLKLADVNFFLTTNLIFPDGKKVIDVNKQSGLHIPGDLYLVGKVVEK